MVVVTSRGRLAELVATDGAQRVQLDGLTEEQSSELLRALLADRAYDHGAVVALARLCGGMPAALRAAAELAAAHPEEELARLVDDLGEHRGGAELLDVPSAPSPAYQRVGTPEMRTRPDRAARGHSASL
jgi:hypothetical protein